LYPTIHEGLAEQVQSSAPVPKNTITNLSRSPASAGPLPRIREDPSSTRIFSAIALNAIRLHAWWTDNHLQHGRTSRLERLNLTLAA